MTRLHLHLLSDSTGETLEMIAKARSRSSTIPTSSAISGRWSARSSISTASWAISPPIRGWCCSPWSICEDRERWKNGAARWHCPRLPRSMR
jgi:hypothetical protein